MSGVFAAPVTEWIVFLCIGGVCRMLAVAAIAAALALPLSASPVRAAQTPLVIQNDHGGLLLARIDQLRQLVASQTPVEIRGAVCHSTCTMLLGLPNVCVSPTTAFGFHGPSRTGAPLEPALFERASQLIASFYPEDLREWYLTSARHHISDFVQKTGAELIGMGVKRCAET
ncbi:hypothetical protein J7413_18400 [Shimia sp. R10_1]|uniref:hypothetical protein n=1 Tax=Shimia sp. R10_1 TaxID=2821095 RepID=UPI001ADCDE95|nr:hypothetical protein [Shimia sp. R10_1]MBO9475519.1 hypothetical protein [Shimia sp. R10_1]